MTLQEEFDDLLSYQKCFMVNDNRQHPLLPEMYAWQRRGDGKVFHPRLLLKSPFMDWDRIIGNFIWFYKFEAAFYVDAAQLRRDKIKVVSPEVVEQ